MLSLKLDPHKRLSQKPLAVLAGFAGAAPDFRGAAGGFAHSSLAARPRAEVGRRGPELAAAGQRATWTHFNPGSQQLTLPSSTRTACKGPFLVHVLLSQHGKPRVESQALAVLSPSC